MGPEPKFMVALCVLIFLIVSGTLFYHIMEKWSLVDSLYFSAVTLTTVGYGDLYPTQDSTKLFTVFYVLVGVSTALYILINLFGRYADMRLEKIGGRIQNRRNPVLKKRRYEMDSTD